MAEALETLLVKVPELDHDVHERVLARLADRVDEAVRSRMSGVGDLGFEAHKILAIHMGAVDIDGISVLEDLTEHIGRKGHSDSSSF